MSITTFIGVIVIWIGVGIFIIGLGNDLSNKLEIDKNSKIGILNWNYRDNKGEKYTIHSLVVLDKKDDKKITIDYPPMDIRIKVEDNERASRKEMGE